MPRCCQGGNAVALDQQVAHPAGLQRAIHNEAVFQQCCVRHVIRLPRVLARMPTRV
ncbi:hypothetical protein D3C71_1895340 [compost metagenome]